MPRFYETTLSITNLHNLSISTHVNRSRIYKPFVFFEKKITKQEEDDGHTKIFGKIIKMKRENVETRCRFLTDYNFIIAAKGSAFNNPIFDRTSGDYFNGLLDGTISIEDFHKYLMLFPKPSMTL